MQGVAMQGVAMQDADAAAGMEVACGVPFLALGCLAVGA